LGQLLVAGIVPGLLTIVVYMISIYIRATRNPKIAPLAAYTYTWREKFVSLRGTGSVLIIFLAIMAGIYTGWFAPSAAGAVGACITLVLLAFRRQLKWAGVKKASLDTAQVTSTLFLIIIGGSLFARFWTLSGILTEINEFINTLALPPIAVVIMFVFVTLVMGCFLDPPSVMVITLPLLHPIVVELGFSGIWFGILIIKAAEIGVITPPVGMNSFVVQAASGGKVKLEDVFAGITPFLLMELITLALLIAFPVISLWLPNTMK